MLKLLFTCSSWHGLAKLRLHIDDTLDLLDEETTYIGRDIRAFMRKTCKFYDTQELKREVDARKRRNAKKTTANAGKMQGQGGAQTQASEMDLSAAAEADEPTPKKLNINTYKAHSLGDYARTIRQLGTTDSYSTVIVGGSS